MANGKMQIITVCGLIAANMAAVALLTGSVPATIMALGGACFIDAVNYLETKIRYHKIDFDNELDEWR